MTLAKRVGQARDHGQCGGDDANAQTAMQAIEFSQSPVIFSHSNARALTDHERNIPDELIKAAAASGGLVGVTGVDVFLGPKGAVVEHLLEHIDYLVQMIGPENVAISMDSILDNQDPEPPITTADKFWPESQYPGGLEGFIPPEEFPKVTQGLLDRGYSEKHIRGILGKNYLALASKIWK